MLQFFKRSRKKESSFNYFLRSTLDLMNGSGPGAQCSLRQPFKFITQSHRQSHRHHCCTRQPASHNSLRLAFPWLLTMKYSSSTSCGCQTRSPSRRQSDVLATPATADVLRSACDSAAVDGGFTSCTQRHFHSLLMSGKVSPPRQLE